jgi:hypothetical protein
MERHRMYTQDVSRQLVGQGSHSRSTRLRPSQAQKCRFGLSREAHPQQFRNGDQNCSLG